MRTLPAARVVGAMSGAIKVTVSDPETGEVLDETVIDNDYVIVCAGTCYRHHVGRFTNGTHVITVKGAR